MILPTTYSYAILCLAIAMVCGGSWPNLQKLAKKWRYELFYLDFSLGVILAAAAAALSLGSLNSKELSFQDNLLLASYHKIGYALGGGVVFNLANLFLVGALSVAPMSVVFSVAVGVGLVTGAGWALFPPQGSVALLLGGATLVLAAVVGVAFTYCSYVQELRAAKSPLSPDPRTSPPKTPPPAKGIALSAISGVIAGLGLPLAEICRTGEDGLGAYSAGLLFAVAMVFSTIVYSPFFFAFAVHGAPASPAAYIKGSKTQHALGLLAGMLAAWGLVAAFASGGTLAFVQAGPVATTAFKAGAAMLAALWGLAVWRDFRGAGDRVRILLTGMLILWCVGAAMVSIAPALSK